MKILVATKPDGSTRGAEDAGITLARRAGARLSVICVVELSAAPREAQAEGERDQDWVGNWEDRAREVVGKRLEEAGVTSEPVRILVGSPAALVTSMAEESHSDLVVLGARQSSGFEHTSAGSAGENIVRRSNVPVLVATQKDSEPFRRIIVAVDLSRKSNSLLDWASYFSLVNGSEVRVVHVEGTLKRLWMALTFRGNRTFLQRPWRRFFIRFREVQFPEPPSVILRQGHPGKVLLREARQWDADLIVVGVRRLDWPGMDRLGRTAKYLLRHGGRSILAVPDRGNQDWTW